MKNDHTPIPGAGGFLQESEEPLPEELTGYWLVLEQILAVKQAQAEQGRLLKELHDSLMDTTGG